MKFHKSLILASSALAGLFVANTATAQSTGTQAVEEVKEVVVTAGRSRSVEGLSVRQTVTKTRSSIDEQFIDKQMPGASITETINLLPGVNFANNDATGISGGDITLRGFDAQRISMTLDGMPLNDTGNYQIYHNQMQDPELFSRVDVNLGTTDVDSPTASATGGTINLTTRRPGREFGVQAKASVGTNNYHRGFARVDTGEFGPWGTTSFLSASLARTDKFKGPGNLERKQINGRIFQPFGDRGDFAALGFHYNENRNHFIARISKAQFDQGLLSIDNTPDAGVYPNFPGVQTPNVYLGTYYGHSINPSNTGNIRGQFKYHLTDNLILTVDPSFQYTLANGGGTTLINEVTGQIGTFGASNPLNRELTGVDINKDGVLSTAVRTYSPSNTRTRRYVVTSSLIWLLDDSNTLRVAYTYDKGLHRQTGAYSLLNKTGSITDEFSADRGDAAGVIDKFGNLVQKRNRKSIAELQQVAITYSGSLFEDRLKLDAGLRSPNLTRDLNNLCYQMNTFTAYCSTSPTAAADAAAAAGSNAVLAPTKFTKKYDKVLPNFGASYNFATNQTVYASYAETLSAPRTDDLYDSKIPTIQPEIGKTFDLGYRYSSPLVSATVAAWYTDFQHRIERAYDEELGFSTSTDIGDVTMEGINAEIGFRPVEGLNIYASTSYTDSEIQNDVARSATQVYATKGKKLNKYAKIGHAVRVNYESGKWNFGVQGKYTGDRYTTLLNTEVAPAYTVWDADVRYDVGNVGPLKDSYLQLNVKNMFNEKYLSSFNPNDVFASNIGFGFQVGSPVTTILTLNTKF